MQKLAELKEQAAADIAQLEAKHKEESAEWQRQVDTSTEQNRIMMSRIAELERQVAGTTVEAAQQSAAMLAEHEDRVATLVRACTCCITFKFLIQIYLQNHELESLRPLKLSLMDREGQIDQLRAKISDQNQELEALRSGGDLKNTLSERDRQIDELRNKISEQNQELEILRAGGDWKAQLLDRDRQIDQFRDKMAEANLSLQSIKKLVAISTSHSQFELQTLRAQQQSLRQYVTEGLYPHVQGMFEESLFNVVKRSSTLVEEATKTLTAKYRYEVQQRKILYNKLQELKGPSVNNVQVDLTISICDCR